MYLATWLVVAVWVRVEGEWVYVDTIKMKIFQQYILYTCNS